MLRIFSVALYTAAAAALILVATVLAGSVLYELATALWSRADVVPVALEGIGRMVIGIAVFDVAKFLLQEEIVRPRELRSSAEARGSLTKFITIMVIAVSLEALVNIFKAGRSELSDLVYPALLFASAVFAVIGLGLHQWLSRLSETPKAKQGPER